MRGTNQSIAILIHQLSAMSHEKNPSWLIKGTSDLSFYFSAKMIELLGRDRPTGSARDLEARGTSSPLQNTLEPVRVMQLTHEQFAPSVTDQQQTLAHIHVVALHRRSLDCSRPECGAFHSRRAQSAWTHWPRNGTWSLQISVLTPGLMNAFFLAQ